MHHDASHAIHVIVYRRVLRGRLCKIVQLLTFEHGSIADKGTFIRVKKADAHALRTSERGKQKLAEREPAVFPPEHGDRVKEAIRKATEWVK
jgi:hypothetical protein